MKRLLFKSNLNVDFRLQRPSELSSDLILENLNSKRSHLSILVFPILSLISYKSLNIELSIYMGYQI